MLFCVVGPFGLPVVWKNPRFSRTAKGVLTVVMIGYTVWLIELSLRMVTAVTESVSQFNATLRF